MPRAKSNGIELEYDTFGQDGHPPLLLIMGLGAQMTGWEGARLRVLEDMGHDLPEPLWPEIVDAIVANARRAA